MLGIRQTWLFAGGLLAGFVLCLQPADAQYTTDFQTNLISGVTSNWPVFYIVGNTNFADVLLIRSGGVLADGGGLLGANFGGSNNSVSVSGTGSVWSSPGGGGLIVGGFGPGNSLVISNGGSVLNLDCFVGQSPSSSNNRVLVTGTGSVWSTGSSLQFGASGAGNSLVISNGGQVIAMAGFVGFNSGSSNNTVLVTGNGSIWSNLTSFVLGQDGTRNSLVISNGGQVVNGLCHVGDSASSSNNSVRVAGGGVWQNDALHVGYQGTSNLLEVTGGSVYATNLVVGFSSATCNNLLRLTSGNVAVTNETHDAELEVRHGQLILSGGTLRADLLVMTNNCASLIHTAGSLIVGSVVLDPNMFRITSITRQGSNFLITWMMGPGQTNALQAAPGGSKGSYATNGFADIFVVTNNPSPGTVTNYLDVGGATNKPARYYRARLAP